MKRKRNKHRSPWIYTTFSIAILTLVIIGATLIFLSMKNEAAIATEKKKNTAPPPTTIKTIESKYPGIQIVNESSNDPAIPFKIQYPKSIHNSFNTMIAEYIEVLKQTYFDALAEKAQGSDTSPSELTSSFEIFPHHSSNYSFVFETTTFVKDSKETSIQSFQLNTETGKSIAIQDVFEYDEERLKVLSNTVRTKLFEDTALSETITPDQATLHTEPLWENFKNFALTDEEIVFHFEKSTIASDKVSVTISLDELDDILATNFKVVKKENVPEEPTKNGLTDKDIMNQQTETAKNQTDQPTKTDELQVALTFDDGPDPKVTMDILETLEKYSAKATFFMLGSQVEKFPEIAKNVSDAGHELANHSWSHPDLRKLNIEGIKDEILNTTEVIESATGSKVTGGFRPPYGAFNDTVRAQTDMPIILWDVDTLDWQHRNPNQLLTHVKNKTRDGSIILMHDIHQSTADGLDAVLSFLKDEGYTFVTISELD